MTEKLSGREAIPEIDFKKYFDKRLREIAPLPNGVGEWLAKYHKLGSLRAVKRKCPAVIFDFPEEEPQLWLTDPRKIEKKNYPHEAVKHDLQSFLFRNGLDPTIGASTYSAYVIQDDQDYLYLFVEGHLPIKKRENLIQHYGITKATADLLMDISIEDIINIIREDNYLMSFAKKYAMTNSQFMRFRSRAISSRIAALEDKEAASKGIKHLVDLDVLAKEVIAQEKEDGHL